MSELILEFTPTPEDHKKTTQALLTKKTTLWLITGWFGIPLIVLLFALFFRHAFDVTNFNRFAVGLAVGFVVFWYPFSIPGNAKRQAIKNKKLCAPVQYKFNDQEILLISNEQEVKYKWKAYKTAYESRHYYFLALTDHPLIFQYIPKKVFEQLDAEKRFRELLVQHVSDVQFLGAGIVGWKLWALSTTVSLIVNYFFLEMIS